MALLRGLIHPCDGTASGGADVASLAELEASGFTSLWLCTGNAADSAGSAVGAAGAAELELASFTGLLLDAAGADDAAGAAGGFLVELLPLFWRFSLAGVSIPASVAMS